MSSFSRSRWFSHRVHREVTLARWGYFGQPVLVLPTASGDAEEIERWQVIRALSPLIGAGRIKIYSCDSVAGQVWFSQEHSLEHRMWMMNQFQEYIRREVVPAIYADCRMDGIPIWTAGASIGALHAVALVCRYPEAFHRALAMSGTFDLSKYLEGSFNQDFYFSSPLHYLPQLEGPQLEMLRERLILLPSGEGNYEDIGESWRIARTLGAKGVPNRVDSWGPDYHHDWVTWREMLPKYLDEFA